jgi:ferredoxin-type protein NapH
MRNYIQYISIFLVISGLTVFTIVPFMGVYQLDRQKVKEIVKEQHIEVIDGLLQPYYDMPYNSNINFIHDLQQEIDSYNEDQRSIQNWDGVIYDDYVFVLAKASVSGKVKNNPLIFLMGSLGLAVLGGILYILVGYLNHKKKITHKGVYHSPMKNRGWLGILTGTYLIIFYVVLYWYPAYLINLTEMVNPISLWLSGNPASQWFLYGFLYTLVILVMGIRMLMKYRDNAYQKLRTASVMFFQLSFAFLIPEFLILFNLPWHDFKNIWPLDYTFFYEYRMEGMLTSGKLGLFMLFWGLVLIIVGVPVMTYFFGKRWYCSWVCGCGGLAETAGDPYRHLSDKSLKAWKIERYMIHGVLVFAILMTLLTIMNYFFQFGLLNDSTQMLHSWYGFFIGAAFAGVVGTGFYPFMGNRVWCRFGCPLAAYLGIIQRYKSRFRITTNGGQCISCGNCSTYCEMGIDVRWYAQRGQNIVRASCVGCGICASVCPRGVLKLENGPEEGRINDLPIIIGTHAIKIKE